MKQNQKNIPNPQDQSSQQDQAPQVPTTDTWTPAQKLTAALMIGGGAAAAIGANPNGLSTSPSIQRGNPAVTLVKEGREGESHTFTLPDGRRATWARPESPDLAIKLAETDQAGLKATTKFGNQVVMDLPVPVLGTQEDESPQQAADPNGSVEFKPTDNNPYTNDDFITGTNTIELTEDDHGGLEAERNGKPVTGVIHMRRDGSAGFTQTAPAPVTGVVVVPPPETTGQAPLTTGQAPFLNSDHNGRKLDDVWKKGVTEVVDPAEFERLKDQSER